MNVVHRTGCLQLSSYGPHEGGDPYFDAPGRIEAELERHSLDKSSFAIVRADAEAAADVSHVWIPQLPGVQHALWERHGGNGGYVDIPKLFEAQERDFLNHGGEVVDGTVVTVEALAATDTTNRGPSFRVTLHDGRSLEGDRVAVCAGAFSNHMDLLPGVPGLDLTLKTETVVLARVSPETAHSMRDAPSLLWEVETDTYEGVYAIPPMQYPDGEYYLKLGCNMPHDVLFRGVASADDYGELSRWFTFGDTQAQEKTLKALVAQVYPGVPVLDFAAKRCVLARTPTGNPYVDVVGAVPGLFVAAGGNGYGAMCSDEVGRLLAELMMNGEKKWPAELDRAALRAVTRG